MQALKETIIMDQEVKLPAGTTIVKPETYSAPQTTQPKSVVMGVPDFEVDPTLPRIVYPHYTNNDRTELTCTLIRPDGSAHMEQGIPKDPNHPLCKDIFNQYTEEEIAHNTKRQIHLEAKTNEAAKAQEENAKNIKYREDIWEMKQTFLNMDIVKKESNKDLRRKIRKSRTVIEAQAYGIACILREDEQSGN